MLWSQEGLEQLLHLLGDMEMPLGAYYGHTPPAQGFTPAHGKHECIINFMRKSRTKNIPVFFAADTPACMGGWTYLGFLDKYRDKIAHFVTTGLPDRAGEKYMPEPASMYRLFDDMDIQKASASYCIVKPLNQFHENKQPEFIIFFARTERLTGLCHLAYFALNDHHAVAIPFGAGCSGTFAWTRTYQRKGLRRAVIGCTDISCRPYMKTDELSFSVTPDILADMINAAPQSFLAGHSWQGVLKKIKQSDKIWGDKKLEQKK